MTKKLAILLLALSPLLSGFSFSGDGTDGWANNDRISASNMTEIGNAINALELLTGQIQDDAQPYSEILQGFSDDDGTVAQLTVTQTLTSSAYEVHGSKRYSVNNETELATAITACGSGIGGGSNSTGCHIDLACGEFPISNTVTIGGTVITSAKYGVTVQGCGAGAINTVDTTIGGTVLKWTGGAAPVFVMAGCSFCSIINLGIDGNDTATAGIIMSADTQSPEPSNTPMSFSTLNNVTIRDVNGTGVWLAATDGNHQIDSISAHRLSVRDSVGGWRQDSTQSVHISIDGSEFSDITGSEIVSVNAGEINISTSLFGVKVASQVGVNVVGAAKSTIRSNRFEIRQDAVAIRGTRVTETMDTNLIDNNAFVVLGTGATCVDWDRRGSLTFNNNAILASGSGINAGCVLSAENLSGSGELTVTSIGNSHRDVYEAADFSAYGGALDYAQLPWTLGTNTYMNNLQKIGRNNASGPNSGWGVVHWTQIEGMPAGFEDGTDDGESGPSGTGDITSIGSGSLGVACTTADCFEGSGSEDNLSVTGDFEINLDTDSNTTNEFRVLNGSGTEVFSVNESGVLDVTGSLAIAGTVQGSTARGTTSVEAGTATSDGNVTIYNDDAGGDGILILRAKSNGSTALDLPVSGAADGLPLIAESATSTRWGGNLNLGSGTIRGSTPSVVTTDGTEDATMLGEMYYADHATSTSDTTYTLPSAVVGMSGCFYDDGEGGGGIVLDPATGDRIMLGGTRASVNENINSPGVAGAGANGDYICLHAKDADVWVTVGSSGTWVEATP